MVIKIIIICKQYEKDIIIKYVYYTYNSFIHTQKNVYHCQIKIMNFNNLNAY